MSAEDGSALLTGDGVEPFLVALVEKAGGSLRGWALDHVDASPGRFTTATYLAAVTWPFGEREELVGLTARAGGPRGTDSRTSLVGDGTTTVAGWIYPDDPDLPGLARACLPSALAEVLAEPGVAAEPPVPDALTLEVVGYRPRRRAVLRATITRPYERFYVKVLRPHHFERVQRRLELLADGGVPAPAIAAATDDHLLVLRELAGVPLAQAMFGQERPCTAEALIEMLDSMPAAVAEVERRRPWAASVEHYATLVGQGLPSEERRLSSLATTIRAGLHGIPEGDEPTHGDFHEGQVHVLKGRVVGLLDVDTVGPGRRADDLACLVAHLSTVQRMNRRQAERVHALIRDWVPVFDERVDPVELRLRAAAVIISLATAPFRGQETNWQKETVAIIDAAEALVRQVS